LSFPFTVKPAPWKTGWAYALYGLAGLAILVWLLYIYKRKILYEHEISRQQTEKHLANAASKAKSDFLARVSHEVRTPLNGVLGMGELLLDSDVTDEQKIYADSIMASGKHLLDIINDILDLSKIEAGKIELEEEAFNLLDLVDEIIATFASQSKQKRVLFSCVFDSKLDVKRIGDVIRIKQILFNLLSNAFKFTKNGKIKLSVLADTNQLNSVVFKVQDTGIGIDEKTCEDLFKPFVQADSAITRKYGGTGLGLAIVKQLTEKMDGKIQVNGKVNVGSCFKVNLILKVDSSESMPIKSCANIQMMGLLVSQSDLKDSITAYCQRLKIPFSENFSQSMQCLIVDGITAFDSTQLSAVKQAIKYGIEIIVIAFNLEDTGRQTLLQNVAVKHIAPPVTFKQVRQICSSGSAKEAIEHSIVHDMTSQKSLNVLVVEDNHINQQVSIEMLEKLEHTVDIVDSAEEALTLLQRNRYDLLFLDYHLPGMDGLSLIRVWDNVHKIPVIMVTADLTDDLYAQCHQSGLENIVAKPFTQQKLSEAIDKAFDN
jgi:signal transduction histidine kinase/CheY-like chemotaxis protein